jgi:hypothetical protein
MNSTYLNNRESDAKTGLGLSNFGYVNTIKLGSSPYGVKSISLGIAINKLNNYTSRSYTSGINSSSSWLGSLADGLSGIYKNDLNIEEQWNPFFDFPSASWREILAWNTNLIDPLPDSDYDYIGATENIRGENIVHAGEIKQEFYRETTGSLKETLLNASINFNDVVFLGANIGIQSINFGDVQKYAESAINQSKFDSKFQTFTHTYRQISEGTGVNMKFGIILLPFQGLRLGASISTPTWHLIKDEWEEEIKAKYSDGYKSSVSSPVGQYSYRVTTPYVWNIGASYVIGKIGLISFDYEGADYSSIIMMTNNYDKFEFRKDNEIIRSDFRKAHTLRVGAEIKPATGIALRGGYTYYGNPEKRLGYETQVLSGGIGFSNKKGRFIDFGLQKQLQDSESFSLYNDYANLKAPEGDMNISGWKLLVTFGFKF